MTGRDKHGRPERPLAAGELEILLGFLSYQRATPAWKFHVLGSDGLRASVGASTITLGGLLKHLAFVDFAEVARARTCIPMGYDDVEYGFEAELVSCSRRHVAAAPHPTAGGCDPLHE